MNTEAFAPFLDRLKSSVSLVSIAEQLGTPVKRNGSRWTCRCPFHPDQGPSLTIYPDDSWRCFGCGQFGDVIDWYQKRQGCDFVTAVRDLARQVGLELPEKGDPAELERRREIEEILSAYVDRCHQALMSADVSAIQYLRAQGFAVDTIQELRIGLDSSAVKISDLGTPEQRKAAGIIDEHGNRTLPGRIIFPITRAGKIVNLSGRAFADPQAQPKYKNLPGRPTVPFNSHLLRHDGTVCLVEGVKDAAILCQAGIPAVATIGTYVKEEWAPFFSKKATYILLYDGDDAGAKAAHRIADWLQDRGLRANIATLPPGRDPDELVREEGAAAVTAVITAARPWMDVLIDSLPPTQDPGELDTLLRKEVFPRLAAIPAMGQDYYIEQVAARFKVRKPVLRQEWQKFVKEGQGSKANTPASGHNSSGSDDPVQMVFREDDPVLCNPAQDFKDGKAFFTVFGETNHGDIAPFLITSDRRQMPLTPETVRGMGLIFRQNTYPTERLGAWPTGTRYKNSVSDWLSGQEEVNPKAIYGEIRRLLQRFVHYEEDWGDYYDLFTIWTIGTYCHQLFDSYPYIHVRALANSGKTTLLRVVMDVAFNGTLSSNTTEAVISRLVNSDSPTLGIDEAEGYRRRPGSDGDDGRILEVLNSGYKKGAASMKSGSKKDNFKPEYFRTYSPKFFTGIEVLDPVLSTRCLDVPLIRTDVAVEEYMPGLIDRQLKELRGTLYCWALREWEKVEACYVGLTPDGDWMNRSWEVWRPMLALAAYFEKATGEPLSRKMRHLAGEMRETKRQREQEQNSNQRIMGVIVDFVQVADSGEGELWVPTSLLCDKIREELGWKEYTNERLAKFIFDDARLAGPDRTEDKKKMSSAYLLGKRTWHIRLDPPRVYRQAVKQFGFPADLIADQDPEIRSEDPFADNETTPLPEEVAAIRAEEPRKFHDPFADNEG